jgi:aminoglycoside phosphotransferase (APT) family kinase protein
VAVEGGWRRRFPVAELDLGAVGELVGQPVVELELLSGGLRNTNYRVQLKGQQRPLVLRLYTADPGACAREVALLQRVADRVPVPALVRAECVASASPPWALMDWMPGIRFDQMLVSATPAEVRQACASAGSVLATIHSLTFPSPGFLGPNLEIVEPTGYPWLTGVSEFFATDRARMLIGPELAAGVLQLVEREAWRLADIWSQSQLVHADYKPWNLLVQQTGAGWRVSAVLDWEFSLAGPPLCDFGIFLRYSAGSPAEYTSGFVDGYRAAGGSVPDDVRNLARLIDLVSLWTFLERAEADRVIVGDVRPVLEETVQAFSGRFNDGCRRRSR